MPNRTPLVLPPGGKRLLLHTCCAPCVGDIMQRLSDASIDYTLLFYNPNIHPREEYELRKNENMRFAEKLGVPFVDGDYNSDDWFAWAKDLRDEPERGIRCTGCFDMRFEVSAAYAAAHGFDIFTTSLGISRWKNSSQIDESGIRAASRYPGLGYWTFNWRKEGGSAQMLEVSKQEQFYMQEYCGCVYSLRDTNRWRMQNGRERIEIGKQYYGSISS